MSHRKKWLATLLWNTPIFVLVHLFLGETKLFHPVRQTSKPSISFLEWPRLFDVGWLCVLFWRMACLWLCRTINTPWAQGSSGFVCGWHKGSGEGNHLQLVFWHGGVLFFLCQLCASSTENKQNTLALANIVTGSPVWLFFPFLPSHGDRGWHFWKISYCHANTRRTTSL